jgi:hypothetical protein
MNISGKVANGEKFSLHGKITPIWEISGYQFFANIFISDDQNCPYDIIIGVDVLSKLANINFDFVKNRINIGNQMEVEINTILNLDQKLILTLEVVENVTLEPSTDNIIRGCSKTELPNENTTILINNDKFLNSNGLIIGKTLCNAKNGLFIRIINPFRTKIKLYKNQKIANAEILNTAENSIETVFNVTENGLEETDNEKEINYVPPEADMASRLPKFADQNIDLLNNLNLSDSVLSENAKLRLRNLILENSEAFVGPDGIIGHYRGSIKHRIDLIDKNKTASRRPYRVPPALRPEVEKQINEMLKQKIIRPSSSSFSAPIVLVKKADGKSWRFAIDYRQLNENTKKEVYYLPLITDIVELVGGKQLFSCFDFQSGFHQLDVEPRHVERTAFATFLGLFEYLRMPFGLCGAPNSFQKMMEKIRKELSAAFFVYLDDVILASHNEEEHLRDIENFLHILIKFGLKLRLDKCAFGKNEIRYLGFLISKLGVRPDPKNVASVQKFQPPKTLTQLRSFIGAVSYFRRFICNFAKIMSPLYELTKDEGININKWDTIHQNTFELIIEKLVTAPVLAPPRFDEEFIIETDASKIAVGACLMQKGIKSKLEHPICFASRKLNKHEAKYPSVELEALGLVYAIREFRAYIEGSPKTIVRTDNSALCSLFKRKDLEGRLSKYQLIIQEYNIKIEYKKGINNKFCDYLSRYPCPEINILEIERVISAKDLRTEQKANKFTREIYDALVSKKFPSDKQKREEIEETAKQFTIINKLIYLRQPTRLFIPYGLREKIIKIFHGCPLSGAHLGIQKTIPRIGGRFWWPGMNNQIKHYVRACEICQKRKSNPNQLLSEPMKPIEPSDYPFHRIHADIMGPLPITNKNNRYIFSIIDSFSKFLIACAIPDQTALTITEEFVNNLITKFGVPSIVVTDNGRQFIAKIFEGISKIYKFEHRLITAYRPQSNGQIERSNKTVADMLAACGDQINWDQNLQLVVFSYNCAIQSSSKFSPFFVVFGREAKVPCDIALEEKTEITGLSDYSYDNFIKKHTQELENAWKIVKLNLLNASTKQKEYKDWHEKAAETDIKIYDLVLLFNDYLKNKTKFSNKWRGPYRVMKIKPPNIILRELKQDGKLFKTHINKIKKFLGPYLIPITELDEIVGNKGDPNLEEEAEE